MYYKFHFIPLFSAIINLIFGAVAITANYRRRLNQVFLLLGLSLALWNFCAAFHSQISDPDRSLLMYRIGALGVSIIPAALYHMAVEAAGPKRFNRSIIGIYLCSFAFIVLILTGHPISSGLRKFGAMVRITGSLLVLVYYLFFATILAASIRVLLGKIHSSEVQTRRITRFLVAGFVILGVGILHDAMPLLGFDYYPGSSIVILPLGTVCAATYGLLLGYGLLSDQLLDFRISLNRNGAAILRVLFLLGITYLLLLVFSGYFPGYFTTRGLLASLVIIAFSTTITVQFFPKLLGRYGGRLSAGLGGDCFEYQDKVRAFIREYRPGKDDFTQYLKQCTELVFNQFSLSAIGVAVFDGEVSARGQAARSEECLDWPYILGAKSPFTTWLRLSDRPYIDIREGLAFTKVEQDTRSLMIDRSLMLAFRIGAEDRKPIGLLVTGPRKDGRSLNKLDVEVITLLCTNIVSRAERIAVERNEELQRANQAKDQFLASVNHEIRNPLNGIHGIVQMLKEHCLEGRAKYLLGTLQACTDQLRTTMDDVLDFNQLGPEVADNHPVQTDLVEIVRSTTSSYDLSGHQLVFEPVTASLSDPGSPEPTIPVWCDSGKFSHILMNYLSNALKYGVPPGARVKIQADALDGNMARVKMAVTSTGPSLSKEEVLTLFSPLTRGQRARETKAHGLGLGLALCKKLAHAMGGNVGVESAQGETTFWFVADFPISHPTGPQLPQPAHHIEPRLALAIEDEPYNRLVLGYHLNRLGITPIWAVDGQSALAAAQNRAFDLIVMDWVLPDMEGEALLSELRKNSSSPLPPVVVVSAYSTASKRATGIAAGAAAFVSKPIDESKLAEALAECKLGAPIAGSLTEESPPNQIDLSALKKASGDPKVVQSFLAQAEELYAKLIADWRHSPQTAAASAHKLKGQMLLIRAKDCADLLELLEQALFDSRHSDNIVRLIDAVEHSFKDVTSSIRSIERLSGSNAQ